MAVASAHPAAVVVSYDRASLAGTYAEALRCSDARAHAWALASALAPTNGDPWHAHRGAHYVDAYSLSDSRTDAGAESPTARKSTFRGPLLPRV